ncbi:MAG: alpha-L-rhamnosidase N-terminal domain-containing protein, partial [Trebonia sp.]
MDSPPAARNLRAGYLRAPIGLEAAPVLSWEPAGRQAGYQLVCETLASDAGPAATFTAERMSSSSVHRLDIPLAPVTGYRWRVRTRPEVRWGPWSPWGTFESALLDESGWRGAQWIRSGPDGRAPILSASFTAPRTSRPRLFLCGLGLANARINGQPVGPAVLDPPPSAYDETVWYRVIDVSGLVREGSNELSVFLGRGFYAMTTPTSFNWHKAPWHAEPKLR